MGNLPYVPVLSKASTSENVIIFGPRINCILVKNQSADKAIHLIFFLRGGEGNSITTLLFFLF